MKWIIQFVLGQFAKRSAKKTGVAKLLKRRRFITNDLGTNQKTFYERIIS